MGQFGDQRSGHRSHRVYAGSPFLNGTPLRVLLKNIPFSVFVSSGVLVTLPSIAGTRQQTKKSDTRKPFCKDRCERCAERVQAGAQGQIMGLHRCPARTPCSYLARLVWKGVSNDKTQMQ